MVHQEYVQCKRCIMDTSDTNIIFDENGVCNHCTDFYINNGSLNENTLKDTFIDKVKDIKKDGINKEYDSILGLSGGVDSTYVAYIAKEYGLNPLVIHFDNGWNSELAVENIKNTIKRLGFDLYTYVVNWEEFKDLQLSYLKASVIDIEVITDHAILATLYKLAAKYKLKYILSGTNIATESILPSTWIANKMDSVNIKTIHKKYGKKKLKTYPFIDMWNKLYYFKYLGIQNVSVLDYVGYIKSDAKEIITSKLKWRDYGGKHYESVFTRFYQGYILPKKFNIDKRKAHLSTLICSGQINRDEAISELKKPIYGKEQMIIDKEFVLKKLDIDETSFDEMMKSPINNHSDFKMEKNIFQYYPILKVFKPLFKVVTNNK